MSQTSARTVTAAVVVSVVLLLVASPARAQSAPVNQSPQRASITKRVVWAVIGTGVGFAAGMFLGFNKFDDAVNSDRKVWTSAIVGAVAGAAAGATLSHTVAPGVTTDPRTPGRAPAFAFPLRHADDGALRSRVRAANSLIFSDR